jgi:hypothetical protein
MLWALFLKDHYPGAQARAKSRRRPIRAENESEKVNITVLDWQVIFMPTYRTDFHGLISSKL